MGRTRRRLRKRDQAGVALVEFALILPFVAMVALGTIDLGRVYQLENRLKNAAREGAAYAQVAAGQVVSGAGCTDPSNVTFHALHEDPDSSAFSVSVFDVDANSAVTGCTTSGGPVAGHHLKVTVQSNFRVLTPLVGAITGNTKVVHGTAEVVVQG
jgi:Flp pilus assembly protein TadG